MSPTDNLVVVLAKMIKFALPKLSNEGVCEILRKRMRPPSLMSMLVERSEEVADLVDEDDRKATKATVSEGAQAAAEAQPYAEQYRAYFRAVVPAKKRKSMPKAKAKSQAAAGVRQPIRQGEIDDTVTQARVQSLLPAGHRVWRDAFCCRWQWTLGGEYMGSRSWRKYGYVESAQSIIEAAWAHEARQGVPRGHGRAGGFR